MACTVFIPVGILTPSAGAEIEAWTEFRKIKNYFTRVSCFFLPEYHAVFFAFMHFLCSWSAAEYL